MPTLDVAQFIARSDNFAVLLHDPESGKTAAIDAPDADPIIAALKERGWTLSHILVTHKHFDHIEGIPALQAAYDCEVIGPETSAAETGMYDRTVKDGDTLRLGRRARSTSSRRPATRSTTSPSGCRPRSSSSSATRSSRSAAAASSRATMR